MRVKKLNGRRYLPSPNLFTHLLTRPQIKIGNALFFFDPLRSVEYRTIEKVASNRIKTYYKTGTEFIIFVFTSDWFLGREDFSGLPTTIDESTWFVAEKKTVSEADALFGNEKWRDHILSNDPICEREKSLIGLYQNILRKWFRYVLPLPFNPKANQVFHLMLCSNYEIGVKATRDFYSEKTGNPKYSPNNSAAFNLFRKHHPEIFMGLSGRQRPLQWRMLWAAVKSHEDGISDCMCTDYILMDEDVDVRQQSLDWLEKQRYLYSLNIGNAWNSPVIQYKLNWATIKEKLGIDPPPPLKALSLKPLSLKDISQ